ncbi:MAG: PEP-CTERM sorting domain-containing protein [Planctomycetota bacterium]
MFTSDHNWTVGDFELIPGEDILPPTPAPEPGMLTLLGLGGTLAFIRRRRPG